MPMPGLYLFSETVWLFWVALIVDPGHRLQSVSKPERREGKGDVAKCFNATRKYGKNHNFMPLPRPS